MRIFRVHLHTPSGESEGYEYFTNSKEAEACLIKHSKNRNLVKIDKDDITIKEVVIGKYEFLKLLNQWASHPDNG